MPGAVGFAVVLFAMAVLVASHGEAAILGLAPDQFASLAALSALALLVASAVAGEFRGRWLSGLRALLAWGLIAVGLVGLYSYRDELQGVASRVAGELMPGETTVAAGGEVVVTRRMDGTFLVNGKVNERDVRFVFDTGATTVVLMAEAARTLGIEPGPLAYTVTVQTANGRTLAAPIVLERVSVGSIREQRVRALVAKPGVLHQNLLGMSFLDRLASYEVRQNRLIMRGRGA